MELRNGGLCLLICARTKIRRKLINFGKKKKLFKFECEVCTDDLQWRKIAQNRFAWKTIHWKWRNCVWTVVRVVKIVPVAKRTIFGVMLRSLRSLQNVLFYIGNKCNTAINWIEELFLTFKSIFIKFFPFFHVHFLLKQLVDSYTSYYEQEKRKTYLKCI